MLRPARHLVAFVVVAACLITACGGATKAPAPSPTADGPSAADSAPTATPLPRPRILFAFDQDISESDRVLSQDIASAARDYFVAQSGHDLVRDIHFVLTRANPRQPVGVTQGETTTIYTGNQGWSLAADDVASRISKTHIIAHELFHNLQAAILGRKGLVVTDSAPWVIEGTAEYGAYTYMVAAGVTTLAAIHRDTDPYLSRRLGPAAGTATRTGQAYPVAFLAVEALVGDRGLHVIGDYFADAAQMDWREAFRKNFGQDPLAFINDFEARRPP